MIRYEFRDTTELAHYLLGRAVDCDKRAEMLRRSPNCKTQALLLEAEARGWRAAGELVAASTVGAGVPR